MVSQHCCYLIFYNLASSSTSDPVRKAFHDTGRYFVYERGPELVKSSTDVTYRWGERQTGVAKREIPRLLTCNGCGLTIARRGTCCPIVVTTRPPAQHRWDTYIGQQCTSSSKSVLRAKRTSHNYDVSLCVASAARCESEQPAAKQTDRVGRLLGPHARQRSCQIFLAEYGGC